VSEVLAIIPARSGSKGIVDKNIRPFNGKPLLAYSVEHALNATEVTRVIVSTDSEMYAGIARKYGAETPFLRPTEISGDNSLDIEVFCHALRYLYETEGYVPEICVHLRPTHPMRKPRDIDYMIKLLRQHTDWDSVRTVCDTLYTPFKMWTLSDEGVLAPVSRVDGIKEAYNAPRQILPVAYIQNACIDVVRSRVVTEKHSMTGEIIGGYVQDSFFDIDSESDFLVAEVHSEINNKLENGRKITICFDIDGVIADKNPENNYSAAKPNVLVIELINRLFSAGHTVVLYTARGSATGIDWKEVTEKQLFEWRVSYSDLCFGKPAADIYIDDRLWSIDSLEKLL